MLFGFGGAEEDDEVPAEGVLVVGGGGDVCDLCEEVYEGDGEGARRRGASRRPPPPL